MYQVNNGTYDKYWNDEFEFNAKVNYQYQEIEREIKSVDRNKVYVINSKAEFGDYNFDNNSFLFSPFTEGTYYQIKDRVSTYYCKKCITSTKIDLFFTNATSVGSIPIDPEMASNLVKRRKDSYGKVDRNVLIKVYFKLTDKLEENVNGKNHDAKLYATIQKIDVIDTYGYNNSKGSHATIATIEIDNSKEIIGSNKIEKQEDPEINKLKSYINSSFVDQGLKAELLEVINKYNN